MGIIEDVASTGIDTADRPTLTEYVKAGPVTLAEARALKHRISFARFTALRMQADALVSGLARFMEEDDPADAFRTALRGELNVAEGIAGNLRRIEESHYRGTKNGAASPDTRKGT